jgi:hypothetical protein
MSRHINNKRVDIHQDELQFILMLSVDSPILTVVPSPLQTLPLHEIGDVEEKNISHT